MIKAFEDTPGEDGRFQLPPGIHVATWLEMLARFGSRTPARNPRRPAARAAGAQAAGCRRAYVDGSLITSKEVPRDFDGCWDHADVDFDALDPVLLDFEGHREAQKAKFDGEMFLAAAKADRLGNRFLEFFQLDRDGRARGIIQIDLRGIP